MEEIKKGKQNNIGQHIVLTENVEYVCPSDGYFLISSGKTAGNIASAFVNGVMLIRISNPASGGLASYQNSSIFVKEGMRIKFEGYTASFYPIV